MADTQAAEVSAAERVRQAAREAAIARAQTAAEPVVELGPVREAVKRFNGAVHQVPDYMHIHCSQILDALRILDRVLKDLIAYDCKSPKDSSKPMSIKAKAFRKKSHELETAYKAVLLLGFKEEVLDLEKHLVYHGIFSDAAQAKEYLSVCSERLETTLRDVERHAQVSTNTKDKKQTVEQRQRAAAMAQYEEDRARQKERAARERRLRGDTVAATPIESSRQSKTATPSVGAATKVKNPQQQLRCTQPEQLLPPHEGAPEPSEPHSGSEDQQEEEEDDEMEDDEEEEEEEGEPLAGGGRSGAGGSGLRQRFPGQGNRLGGAVE